MGFGKQRWIVYFVGQSGLAQGDSLFGLGSGQCFNMFHFFLGFFLVAANPSVVQKPPTGFQTQRL